MKHASSRAPDLLHGPVFSNMTRFFLPIMLGSLLQQLYSMVDAVVLGRLVGKTALAAVGGSDLAIINLVVGFLSAWPPARASWSRSITVRGKTARCAAPSTRPFFSLS